MKKPLLKIQKLSVKIQTKEVLKSVSLEIFPGNLYVVVGPNASGKSTLANAIMGIDGCKVSSGKISFEGKDITKISSEKRSKLGIAMSWQNPPSIKGMSLYQLLCKISKNIVRNEEIGIKNDFLEKGVNTQMSGGEKKISEILQILSLNTKLIVLDEIDSGLDMRKIKKVAQIINDEMLKKGKAVILITHSQSILEFLKPSQILVLVDGKIVCESEKIKAVLKIIKEKGYEETKLLTNR